ncbi:MAG: class I SAM-dependent methyltransferase [Deltaproteobacteria bacterium]|nr:class I SAM-dependent methyltransferase [Deltaproteobacteria bacterium]MBW2152211.1 class I SAM-dependent methyltransferase [Deltaproteobacteria bacterium]
MNEKKPILGKRYQRRTDYHNYIVGERAKARSSIIKTVSNCRRLSVPCLCGRDDESLLLATIDRWGIPSNHLICMYCGLIRVSPRWDHDTYRRIYEGHFWSLQTGQSNITRERFNLSIKRSVAFARTIFEYVPDIKGMRIIEIGCSYGAGLQHLKGKGALLVGYDFDRDIISAGREFTGLNLRHGGIREALNEMESRYDFVILRHVFEHMLDPFAEGKLLRDLVSDDGLIFIEVPGVLNFFKWSPDPIFIFNTFHVYSYCLRTLRQVMERCGFSLIRGDEHIYSLWKPSLTINISPWENRDEAMRILAFIRPMERKRLWGQMLPIRIYRQMRNWIYD